MDVGLRGNAVYAIVGFLILPSIVKSVMVKRLSEKLHRPVAIRAIRINPFDLSARVEGFPMQDRAGAGPFVAFEELYLNLQAASLLRRGPVLREILLRSPSVTVVRNEDSTYNFSDLLAESASQPSEGGSPLRYSLNNIRIVGGSVDFDDRPKRTRHTVRDLSIAVPFLSNLPYAVDIFVQPSLEANINGTAWALQGMTKPYSASRETTVDLNVRSFGIPHYLEYLPVRRKFRVPTGTLDAKTVLSFSQPAGGSPVVALSGTVALKDLSITDAGDVPVLRLPSLSVGIESLEPLARRATLDNVVLTSPVVSLVRGKTGVLNVAALLPDRAKEAEGKAGKTAPPPRGSPAKNASYKRPSTRAVVSAVIRSGAAGGRRRPGWSSRSPCRRQACTADTPSLRARTASPTSRPGFAPSPSRPTPGRTRRGRRGSRVSDREQ